jgi:cold shock CspA family protein
LGGREQASLSWKSEKAQTVRREQAQEEQGCIAMLKDSYGFVTCVGRDERLFFHFTMLQGCREGDLQQGAEVAFRTREDRAKNRLVAYAVRLLPPGTVQVGVCVSVRACGECVGGPVVTCHRRACGRGAWMCAQRQWPEMEVERVRGVLERAATAEADGLLSYTATDTDRPKHYADGARAPQQRHATATVPFAASELTVPVRLLTPYAHRTG